MVSQITSHRHKHKAIRTNTPKAQVYTCAPTPTCIHTPMHCPHTAYGDDERRIISSTPQRAHTHRTSCGPSKGSTHTPVAAEALYSTPSHPLARQRPGGPTTARAWLVRRRLRIARTPRRLRKLRNLAEHRFLQSSEGVAAATTRNVFQSKAKEWQLFTYSGVEGR